MSTAARSRSGVRRSPRTAAALVALAATAAIAVWLLWLRPRGAAEAQQVASVTSGDGRTTHLQGDESASSRDAAAESSSALPTAPQLAAQHGLGGTLVRVLMWDRRPAVDAHLHAAATDGDFRPLGATDANGSRQVQLSADDHRLAVRHAGSAMFVTSLPTPTPPEFEVRLQRGDEIRGVVRRAGAAVPEAKIVVWPNSFDERRLTYNRARGAALGSPDVLRAVSDARGEFVVAGVRPGTRYFVYASARGAIATDCPEVASNASGVVLELSSLFAARLDFGLNTTCRAAVYAASADDVFEVLDVDAVRQPYDILGLLGVGEARHADYDPAEPVFVFRSNNPNATRVGPLRLRVARAGFEQRSIEFWCEPVLDELPRVDARLSPLATCFGVVAWKPLQAPDGVRLGLKGELGLVVGAARYRLDLAQLSRAGECCLPCGNYEVWHEHGLGRPELLPFSLVLTNGDRVELDLSQAALGGLAIQVLTDGAQSFSAHLPVTLWRIQPGEARPRHSVHFDLWRPSVRDEYSIGALPTGAYLMELNGPFVPEQGASFGGDGRLGPLELRPGEVTRVVVRRVE